MLFDKTLTATLQHWGVMADKPDLNEALQSLLDKLDSVQEMLSLAQNFGSQHKGLLVFLKDLMDAAYDADDLLSEVEYYRLEKQVSDSENEDLLRNVDYRLKQQVNDFEDEDLLTKVDYRLQKASISSTPPSFHDINKATIVPRIREIVFRLEDLVTCLSEALSLLEPEEGLRANPNVFPVASHPLTSSFLLPNEKRFSPSLYHGNHLEVLAEDEFLAMFNKFAFGAEDPSDHLELDEIAKQIARKLNGSSLAAGIVGGLLRDDLDEQHWRSVLRSDVWQQRRSADDIMPILRFSYDHLPAHLQQCLAYCGVFPNGWRFKKGDLVGMWMSQGYIHTKSAGNMSPEEIGSEYFDNLESKSFIQASNTFIRTSNRYMIGKACALYELLHDFAESVSENECLRINLEPTEKITGSVRHIYVHADNLGLLKSCDLKNVRTLIIDGSIDDDDNNVLKEVLNGLKSIRVLSLKNISVGLLSGNIRHLIHLRHLTVKTSVQSMPPDSQFRPYHLQWLIFETDFKGPTDLVLPEAINCLVSLRHLLLPHRDRFRNVFDGIGKLTHLQELESFAVGKKEGHTLGELKGLNELGGALKLLSIRNVSTKEEALEANLNKKTGIRKLELVCAGRHASAQMAEEVFEGLRPPPYLVELTLTGYNGAKSPSWMVTENHCLAYLQSLYLWNCSSWKVLPPLGELPLLKHLDIKGADSVEEIGSSFYGSGVAKAFPCLDTLKFANMRELVLWSGVEIKDTRWEVSSGGEDTCLAFPLLRELNVIGCWKLEEVPIQYMATIEVLKTSSPLLLAQTENLTSLRDLFIEWCHQIVSVKLKRSPSLEKLHIRSCIRIRSVPLLPATLQWLTLSGLPLLSAFSTEQEESLSDLTSLQVISISYCPTLHSLPIMPASLLTLSIDNCPSLPRQRYWEGGDDWHKISHVPTIDWQKREED